MEKLKERWVVWMPCKGYVKRWLVANFNRPDYNWPEIVNLGSDKVLQKSFYNHLKRGYAPRGGERDVNSRYPEQVAIEFTKTAFYRYGWRLSDRELVEFNNELEARVRLLLRSYATAMRTMGVSVNDTIQGFRVMTGIGEGDWSEDSIRKDILRHVSPRIDGSFREFMLKLAENVCAQMTEMGQLTRQGCEVYTKNLGAPL